MLATDREIIVGLRLSKCYKQQCLLKYIDISNIWNLRYRQLCNTSTLLQNEDFDTSISSQILLTLQEALEVCLDYSKNMKSIGNAHECVDERICTSKPLWRAKIDFVDAKLLDEAHLYVL